jgi:hypothetical protein
VYTTPPFLQLPTGPHHAAPGAAGSRAVAGPAPTRRHRPQPRSALPARRLRRCRRQPVLSDCRRVPEPADKAGGCWERRGAADSGGGGSRGCCAATGPAAAGSAAQLGGTLQHCVAGGAQQRAGCAGEVRGFGCVWKGEGGGLEHRVQIRGRHGCLDVQAGTASHTYGWESGECMELPDTPGTSSHARLKTSGGTPSPFCRQPMLWMQHFPCSAAKGDHAST